MLSLIVLLALAAYNSASPLLFVGRIVNGTDAKPGEIPYIVSLRRSRQHICGGTILDKTHILTAAHCVEGSSVSALSIQYGVLVISPNDFQAIEVDKVFVHEGYESSIQKGLPNDIAVIKLKSAIPLSENAQKVSLPAQNQDTPVGKWSISSGWGLSTGGSYPKTLQRVDILVSSHEQCRNANGSCINSKIHVCAGVPKGGKGPCGADSGGPLVVNGKQIGITSWAMTPCGFVGYPAVYARVANYIDWINEKVKL